MVEDNRIGGVHIAQYEMGCKGKLRAVDRNEG